MTSMAQTKEKQMQQKARRLINMMTLDEKISQMMNETPGIPRLGIKPYDWWNEGLHGVGRDGRATVFPQPIGMGATFNPALIRQIGDAIATEGRAKYNVAQRNNNYARYAGLTFWSPNINIFRDPRWGRGMETYGEDPFLTGTLGTAYVQGMQGNDPFYLKVAACGKHYAVHSGPEATRHEANVSPTKNTINWALDEAIAAEKTIVVMGNNGNLEGEEGESIASETRGDRVSIRLATDSPTPPSLMPMQRSKQCRRKAGA